MSKSTQPPQVGFERDSPDNGTRRSCGSVLKGTLAERMLCPFCWKPRQKIYPLQTSWKLSFTKAP